MARILVVEDDKQFQEAIKTLLTRHSHEVSIAGTVETARAFLRDGSIDLILLDCELPDGEGHSLCAWAQSQDHLRFVPIVFLTGRTEVESLVSAFSLGAEDYLVKPFEGRELMARISARLQKAKAQKKTEDVVVAGNFKFLVTSQKLLVKGSALELTPHEFRLLLYMALREGQPLGRDELIAAVWGKGVHVLDRTIDTHISHLRKKLRGTSCRLQAVHGKGYKMSMAATDDSKAA